MHVPPALQRLVDQIDGWLDLRCPERALELVEPLLADPEGRPAGLTLRIRACARLGHYERALADLGELRELRASGNAGDDDWIDLTEAWCRRRVGDLDGAIRCAQLLVDRNGRSDTGYFNLGCYHALNGDATAAIDALSMACGLNPTCRDYLRDEPDLDELRTDERFRQLLRKSDS